MRASIHRRSNGWFATVYTIILLVTMLSLESARRLEGRTGWAPLTAVVASLYIMNLGGRRAAAAAWKMACCSAAARGFAAAGRRPHLF